MGRVSDDRLEFIAKLIDDNGYEHASSVLDLSTETLKRYMREYKSRCSTVQSEVREKDTITQTVVSSTKFKTVEDLAEYCDIDLSVWEAEKIISNQYGSEEKPSWQFKVIWKRQKGLSPEFVLKVLEEKLCEKTPKSLEVYKPVRGNVCAEISVPDIHIGRLAFAEQSGGDYDSDIAVEEWLSAHQYFLSQVQHFSIDTIIIPIGNDYFNVNSQNFTMHGTAQNEDTFIQESFRKGCSGAVQAIDLWRSHGYTVKVVIVPGNHDQERIYYLGAYLSAWYKDTSQVYIDNNPKMRKYVVYGRNLIGFSHGQKDYKRLSTVYQQEMREYLSQCDSIEFHVGHTHQEKAIQDFGNMIIRTIPSLAQKSAWEDEYGYSGLRRAQAFVWDKTKGLSEIIYYTPDFLE